MCLLANERTQCISVWRSCTKRTWVFQDKFRKRSLKKILIPDVLAHTPVAIIRSVVMGKEETLKPCTFSLGSSH